MILIGENINVMNKSLRQAMKEREKGPIQEIASKIKNLGMDYLDVNIGPARKDGPRLMEWIIKTIREVVDLPLFLDTTNLEAMKVGLELEGGRAVINSISVTPERMETLFPLMKKYNARCVALLIGKEGMPRDATERGSLAAEFIARADEEGIPHENIYFDPIILPLPFQQNQVVEVLEFMKFFKELVPDANSTCGLSNVSNGAPGNLRGLINRTYLVMLSRYGLDSAIIDAFDKELVSLVRGEKKESVDLIYRVMEGEELDLEKLSEEERNFVKTTKVLLGKSLYSHSWLKI